MKKLPLEYYGQRGLNSNKTRENWMRENDPDLYAEIISHSKKLWVLSFPERLFLYMNELNKIPVCKNQDCGKELVFKTPITKGYWVYCSSKCCWDDEEDKRNRVKTYKKTIETKYWEGVSSYFQTSEFKEKNRLKNLRVHWVEFWAQREDVKAKIKKTVNEKYGGKAELGKLAFAKAVANTNARFWTNVSQLMHVPEIVNKCRATNMARYGAESTLEKGTSIRENIERTNMERYGSKSPFWCSEVKNKSKLTIFSKIKSRISENISYDISENEFLEKWLFGTYHFKCLKCGNEFDDKFVNNSLKKIICYGCRPRNVSKYEKEIHDFIKSLSWKIDVRMNDRKVLSWKELDIYVPSHKLAIEYDGIQFHSFWKSRHSMFDNFEEEPFGKYSHLKKSEECLKHGIDLFHIFSNEWDSSEVKKSVWKSKISKRLWFAKVFSGTSSISRITKNDAKTFLERVSLNQPENIEISIGLIWCWGELVAVMSFSRVLMGWALTSFESDLDVIVPKALSMKMIEAFIRTNNLEWIPIFAKLDRRFQDETKLIELWFSKIETTEPSYSVFKERNHSEFISYRNCGWDIPDIPSWYRRIWDCWKSVYEMKPRRYQ